MSIGSSIAMSLRRFGSRVSLVHGTQTVSCYAFVQPLRRRHRLYINDTHVPAGYFDNAYRLYIGEGSRAVTEGDRIISGSECYTVVAAESFFIGSDVLYNWAVLSPKRDEEEVYADEYID